MMGALSCGCMADEPQPITCSHDCVILRGRTLCGTGLHPRGLAAETPTLAERRPSGRHSYVDRHTKSPLHAFGRAIRPCVLPADRGHPLDRAARPAAYLSYR